MFRLMILALLASVAFGDFNPQETCTYQNEKFWIMIVNLCEEGEIECDNVVYIGVNKKDPKKTIVLQGRAYLTHNLNFGGYEFKNGDYTYTIRRDSMLYIKKNGKIILEMPIDLC